jgi:hypothetical protein
MGIAVILLLVPLISLALCSVVFPSGPRFLQLATLACALLALWLLSRWHPAAGLVWLVGFGALKGAVWLGWQKLEKAKAVVSGQPARYLSVSRPGHKAPPFVMYLPPLRAPLYWVARRARVAVPQAGNRPASEFLLPLLDMLFKSSSGFVLDTRHLAGRVPNAKGAPPVVIKCL